MANVRKPPELKLLTGRPGRTPVEPIPPITPTANGKPRPNHGNLKGEAFAEWCRVTDYLASIGKLESVDYAALIVYCTAWQTFESAREMLENHGPVVQGRDGGLVKNPAHQVMRDSSDTMLKFGGRFGFTPKDRQNMGISLGEKPGDELGDFLNDKSAG